MHHRSLLLMSLLVACDESGRAPAPTTEGAPTYHGEIAPLLGKHCTGCHSPGGIGAFALDNLADTRLYSELALSAMQAGRMPPWMPDRSCRTYQNERGVTADEVARFAAWIEADKPEGPAPASVPEVSEPAWQPTRVLPISTNHLPTGDLTDDYRCFILSGPGATFPEDAYLTASQVVPGSSQVHHVLVYAIGPEQRAALAAADASDAEPGYPCFGSPLPGGPGSEDLTSFFAGGPLPDLTLPAQIGSWVPGAIPQRYPEGTAIRIVAGATLVAQVHYNLTEGRPLPDSTRIEMVLTTAEPTQLVDVRPLALRDLTIPAGASDAVNVGWFPYDGDEPLVLASVAGHMHLRGTRLVAEVVRQGGAADNECALSIPRWDFHWQQSYRLLEDDRIVLEAGDGVRLTCAYDNSADNQPLLDGVRPEPVDVAWGEGTGDEMCILYYSALKPFTPSATGSTTPCGAAASCLKACGSPPALGCVMGCSEASASCQLCTLRAGLRCSGLSCLAPLREASECLGTCLGSNVMLGSNSGRCLARECASTYEALEGCMDPGLTSGECGAELAACGITP